MKRASISIDMLVVIIIAVIAMAIFLLFFTGKAGGLFGQIGQLSPSESETAKDSCQIACNNAKLRSTCEDFKAVWCNKPYGNTGKTCLEMGVACEKEFEGKVCTCSE